MIELCEALKTIHAANIVHRDIKPENVFLVNDQYLKIGDLGISRKIEPDDSAHTRIGTPRYLAPEVYKGEAYTFTADIWSLGTNSWTNNKYLFYLINLGIMLVELVKLKAPIINPYQTSESCLCMTYGTKWIVSVPHFSNSDYGTNLYKMTKRMLKYEQRERPTAEELEKFLRRQPVIHPK